MFSIFLKFLIFNCPLIGKWDNIISITYSFVLDSKHFYDNKYLYFCINTIITENKTQPYGVEMVSHRSKNATPRGPKGSTHYLIQHSPDTVQMISEIILFALEYLLSFSIILLTDSLSPEVGLIYAPYVDG